MIDHFPNIRFHHVQFTHPNSKQYIKANNSLKKYINAMLNYTYTILCKYFIPLTNIKLHHLQLQIPTLPGFWHKT